MSEFAAIRAMAFDLDGTLTDSVPGLTLALDQALRAMGLAEAGQQRVVHWIGNGADVMTEKALNWALQQQTPPATPQPEQQQRLRQLFDEYYQHAVTCGSVLYPAVGETLQTLHARGLPLALVTNKPSKFVVPLLQSVGIAGYFTLILGGDDVVIKKPHPAALFLVLGRLGLLPRQLLFVGDSRNDILAAQAAGCPCVGMSYGYNYGESIAQSHPDRVLDQFADLLKLINNAES